MSRGALLASLVLSVLAFACQIPTAALALEQRPLLESFGADGTSASTFERPSALAFDQGSKRLYAIAAEAQKLYAFDESVPGAHTALTGNFPLSVPSIEFDALSLNSSSHDLYFTGPSENKLFGFDSSGVALSGFPVAGQSFSCGTALDSSGNIWVAQGSGGSGGKIREYSTAGVLINTITVGGEPCSIAFDSADNLYVAFLFAGVKKFTAASGYTSSTNVDPEAIAVAVDRSTDQLYVARFGAVAVYEPDGTFLYEFGNAIGAGEGFFTGVAIDEAAEKVYVSSDNENQMKVLLYGPPLAVPKASTEGADEITATGTTVHGAVNPKGQSLSDCKFEYGTSTSYGSTAPCVPAAGTIPADSSPHSVSAALSGLESATIYHYRLVATNAIGTNTGLDRTFVSGPAAPLINEQSVEAIGFSDAIVRALINPRGSETTYHVEYGPSNAYGQSTTESAPFGFSSDHTPRAVAVHIDGLDPATTYHFRFVATNSVAGAQGSDATFATSSAPPSFGPCPNDRFRGGPGSALPDCRAYEQATPVDKHGADAQVSPNLTSASIDGDHVTFFANGGLPTTGGSTGLYPYMATRSPAGWSFDGLQPPTVPGTISGPLGSSEDLSTTLAYGPGPGGSGITLYLRDSATGAYQQVGPVMPDSNITRQIKSATLSGFASDTSHLAFKSLVQMLPGAPAGQWSLYDLDHGTLTIADRIPTGSLRVCDDVAGPACIVPSQGIAIAAPAQISPDGSSVVFSVTGAGQAEQEGRIYVREDQTKTTWISASQRTAPDPNGEKPAEHLELTHDGSRVLFLSCEKLTDDSTAVSNGENACNSTSFGEPLQGRDLYSYDLATQQLSDLSVDHNAGDPLGAAVQEVLGSSDDGSYVYFTADGVLAPGASPDHCLNSFFGKCNLYVYHSGVTKFIAKVRNSTGEAGSVGGFRVSADGTVVLFGSIEKLTEYNNTGGPGVCGGFGELVRCNEFYRYSAPEEKLTCVSCNPTGASPVQNARLGSSNTTYNDGHSATFRNRNLSANGSRAFFESPDPLVSTDTNGAYDVYEWEEQGSGTCKKPGGCLYLLSGGAGRYVSRFVDASANGDHVFISTNQQLVPSDEDQLYDIYDAAVGGGLADQHPLASATCTTSACQANPPPPSEPTASSAAFEGPGNVHQRPAARKCPKGKRKVRKVGKASCQKTGKQHKRHGNRGGSK
jgi:hypothetical protein